MTARAERGLSAPSEVVFNTAIDPSRNSAWLPRALRTDSGRPECRDDPMRARWRAAGWTANLTVEAGSAGGAQARLELAVEPAAADVPDDRRLTEIAHHSLAGLAGQVIDNLTAG